MILDGVLKSVTKIADKFIADKDTKIALQHALKEALLTHEQKLIETQASIIITEAKGSWMQRNWRPSLMMVIVAIIANNFLVTPILIAFGLPIVVMPLPEYLYTTMNIGLGGYIVGRSGEKIMQTYKK